MKETSRPFSATFFLFINIINLAFVYGVIALFFPSVWAQQFSASWYVILATFFVVHLVNAFVEFFVHRYVLHLPVVSFMRTFYRSHTAHHGVTAINKDGMLVSNRYPIEEAHQHENSFMPWFTFLIFSLFYAPFFIAVHIINPAIPIFLVGYATAFFSMAAYELSHAMMHWPIAVWNSLFSQPIVGPVWKQFYKHHMRHHVDVRYNESVFGFFGFPITDLIFGTYVNPQTLYPHGSEAIDSEFQTPSPSPFIQWLDKRLLPVAKDHLVKKA